MILFNILVFPTPFGPDIKTDFPHGDKSKKNETYNYKVSAANLPYIKILLHFEQKNQIMDERKVVRIKARMELT